MDRRKRRQQLFELFNEIGIIQQLAGTAFNQRLPEGLHVSHFSVVNHLCRLGDGRTPLRIARAFQVSKATMTNTLSKLEARRLIQIRDNPDDGRSKLVFVTDKGRAFRSKAIATLHPMIDRLDDDLDTTRLLKMLPTLRALRAYLDDNRDA